MTAKMNMWIECRQKIGHFDFIWQAGLALAVLLLSWQYADFLQMGDRVFFIVSILGGTLLAWRWLAFRWVLLGSLSLAALAYFQYDGHLARVDQVFLLKYGLSSQSAFSWMSLFFLLSMGLYWLSLVPNRSTIARFASRFSWLAVLFGGIGFLVRWHESYLISAQFGHFPISNLYEVSVLFCVLTACLYLWYERKLGYYTLGAFVLPVVNAGVFFMLWLSLGRGAYGIEPLIPALQSYWMVLHVPANFVGYGAFALAAMLSIAYLFCCAGYFRQVLPSLDVLENLTYQVISVGFLFFTIATILGAVWAAEAWGSYWQWDPKETWALIVWLNYASWLHCRLMVGMRGTFLAWWAVVGLLLTLFAFLGVNMFLSGLHSYGGL